jgi:hypothetical protein
MYTHVYIHIYIHTYIHIHIHTQVGVILHMSSMQTSHNFHIVTIYMYIYIYIYIYIYTLHMSSTQTGHIFHIVTLVALPANAHGQTTMRSDMDNARTQTTCMQTSSTVVISQPNTQALRRMHADVHIFTRKARNFHKKIQDFDPQIPVSSQANLEIFKHQLEYFHTQTSRFSSSLAGFFFAEFDHRLPPPDICSDNIYIYIHIYIYICITYIHIFSCQLSASFLLYLTKGFRS